MGYRAGNSTGDRVADYDVVRVLWGLILLTAAGLKGYQLATDPVVGNSLLNSRWFLMATVESSFSSSRGYWPACCHWPRRQPMKLLSALDPIQV